MKFKKLMTFKAANTAARSKSCSQLKRSRFESHMRVDMEKALWVSGEEQT